MREFNEEQRRANEMLNQYNKRRPVIQKSIKLIGWGPTSDRITTPVDRKVYDDESEYFKRQCKEKEDAIFRKHGITF